MSLPTITSTIESTDKFYLDKLSDGRYAVYYYEVLLKTFSNLEDARVFLNEKAQPKISNLTQDAVNRFVDLRGVLIEHGEQRSNIRLDFKYGSLTLQLHDTYSFTVSENMQYKVNSYDDGKFIGLFKTVDDIMFTLFSENQSNVHHYENDDDLYKLVEQMNNDWKS